MAGLNLSASAWHLCVVTDVLVSRGRSHLEVAKAAIDGGADVIQFRDKNASGRTLYETARDILSLTRAAGIPLIVNDRVDIALAVGADGVHVGQDDLPATAARRLLGNQRILGVSAACPEEALQAARDGADYVGFGPVFEARGTKPDSTGPLGTESLAEACAGCPLPVIAIGGIHHGNVSAVMQAGARGVAVISGVVGAVDMALATRELKERIDRFLAGRAGSGEAR